MSVQVLSRSFQISQSKFSNFARRKNKKFESLLLKKLTIYYLFFYKSTFILLILPAVSAYNEAKRGEHVERTFHRKNHLC